MPIWRPEAIIFDVSDTLFNTEPLRTRFGQAGLPSGALDIWLARVQRDGIANAAAGTFVAFQDVAAFHLKSLLGFHSADAIGQLDSILAAFREIPPHADVEAGLARFREGEARMATLTNEPAELTSVWLERSELRHYFEQVFDTSAVMAWKPRPEPYVYAARELGLATERTALVSAHPWDIHGATCAGLVGAWLHRPGAAYPQMMNPPDVQADTLDELAGRLLHLPRW